MVITQSSNLGPAGIGGGGGGGGGSRLLRVCVHTSRYFHFHKDKCTLRNITLSPAVFFSVLLTIYVTCAGKMSLNYEQIIIILLLSSK